MVQENVREAGRDHTLLLGALSRTVQEAIFDSSCFQPFINHPSDNAVCDSLVEERSKVGVRNRIEGSCLTLPTSATSQNRRQLYASGIHLRAAPCRLWAR